MKYISWNYKGLGSKSLSNLVKDLTRSYKIDLFAILKHKVSGEKVAKRIMKTRIKASIQVDLVQYSGGIWVLWDPLKVNVSVVEYGT